MAQSPRIEAAADSSKLVRDALETARRAHAGQIRNGSGGMPYIDHPTTVAELLAENGYGEQVLAAGLLHDVVEESAIEVDEIRESFGEPIASMVAALTDEEATTESASRSTAARSRPPAPRRGRSTAPTSSPTSAPCAASTPAAGRRSATS
jgi:(p)ppGpp synthase/HD superfamily hydrolase